MNKARSRLADQSFSFGKPYQEDQLSNLNALAAIDVPRAIRVSC